jgi:prenyltransferase beta subunit
MYMKYFFYFALSAIVAIPAPARSTPVRVVGAESALAYILSSAVPSGGFGSQFTESATLFHTAWAAEALKCMDIVRPHAAETAEFLTNITSELRNPREWHALATATSLYDVTADPGWISRLRSTQKSDGGWAGNDSVSTLEATYFAVAALARWNATPVHVERAARFAMNRLRREGFFTNQLRSEPLSELPHLWRTYCGVRILYELGYDIPWREAIAVWTGSCQNEDGGFAGTSDVDTSSDLWNTANAVEILATLDVPPQNSTNITKYVNTLQNHDGGFSVKLGEASQLASTCDAVRTLSIIHERPISAITSKAAPVRNRKPSTVFRDLTPFAVYDGPTETSGDTSRTVVWRPGIPLYSFEGTLEEAIEYLRLPEIGVQDSTIRTFLLGMSVPPLRVTLSPGNALSQMFEIWLPNGLGADSIRVFRGVWSFLQTRNEPVDWNLFIGMVIQPLSDIGALICWQTTVDDRISETSLVDKLLTTKLPVGILIAGATSDGRNLVERNPYLERLVETVPFAVVDNPYDPHEVVRVMWLGRSSSMTDLRYSLRSGLSACTVGRSESSTLYGPFDVLPYLYRNRLDIEP